MHAHISGRQNKNNHAESESVDFEKNMPDSCAAFGCTNRRSTTSLHFYCIPSAEQYPKQRITKWITAKNDPLRK